MPSGDTGESQRLLEPATWKQTKTQAGGLAQRVPGPEGQRTGPGRGPGQGPRRRRAGGKAQLPQPRGPAARPAPSPRAPPPPTPRSRRDAGAARTTSPRKPRGRRGAGPGAIPRDPARWEAPRRTQRPEGGERRAGGAGRGRGRRGPEPCVPWRGPAGLAAGGAGNGLRGLHGACGSVPARRAARGRLSAGFPGRRAAQHAARGPAARPERCGHCPGAGPRPRSAERGGRLGFNGCSAGQRLGVEAAAAQEGARASLPRGRPRPPRRAPWGPADPGRRGPLARRPRVPAMN